MSNIQRALDHQAKLEAEATEGPWKWTEGGPRQLKRECAESDLDQYYATNAVISTFGSVPLVCKAPDRALIAHLRNQSQLMRSALAAADERINGAIDMGVNPLYFERYFEAVNAWAEHVLGDANE